MGQDLRAVFAEKWVTLAKMGSWGSYFRGFSPHPIFQKPLCAVCALKVSLTPEARANLIWNDCQP
jgi:hypothetical protein